MMCIKYVFDLRQSCAIFFNAARYPVPLGQVRRYRIRANTHPSPVHPSMARISMYTGASKKFNSNLRYAFMVIKKPLPQPLPKGEGSR